MPDDKKPLALVVDDSKASLELFDIHMSKQGFKVVTALSAEQALGKLADTKPDIIVLDVVMPEIDGFKLCMLLRQRPDTKTTPVIFLTSTASDQRAMAEAVGGNDIVAKPFDARELADRLRGLIANTPR